MARPLVRFGFVIEDGPNRGLACGGWRVWTRHEDTYITAKSLNGTWKTSLHGDAVWQLAVTKEHLRAAQRPVWTEPDRAPFKFRPTRFVDGKRLAFVVAATRGALPPQPLDSRELRVAVEDRWDTLTSVWIWMTETGRDFHEDGLLAGPLPLASGRNVWTTQTARPSARTSSPSLRLCPRWWSRYGPRSMVSSHRGCYFEAFTSGEPSVRSRNGSGASWSSAREGPLQVGDVQADGHPPKSCEASNVHHSVGQEVRRRIRVAA
jgi:hypothetical protein